MKNSLLLLVFSVPVTAAPLSVSREGREIELAERVLLLSRLQFASPSMRVFCARWRAACVSNESNELALAFIGRLSSEYSMSAMVDLVRLKLGAGPGQDHACYVLASPKVALPLLQAVDAEVLHGRCIKEVMEMRSDFQGSFGDVQSGYVCADSESIRARVKGLIDAAINERACAGEDF